MDLHCPDRSVIEARIDLTKGLVPGQLHGDTGTNCPREASNVVSPDAAVHNDIHWGPRGCRVRSLIGPDISSWPEKRRAD